MSDVKCPICQNNLHKINIVVSTCTNDKCKLWGSSIPNLVLKALTQAKHDLEIAKNGLRVVRTQYRLVKPRGFSPRGDMATLCAMGEFAEKNLEQIEHKEKQNG